MAIESASDRQAFMDVFGTTAVVSGQTITAIFDDPHLNALEVRTSTPMLTCVTSDVLGVAHGDTVVVSSESFSGSVIDVQSDGTGITVLMLRSS